MTGSEQSDSRVRTLPEQSESVPLHISGFEDELGRTAALVGEIVDARKGGDFDTLHGNADDDLLAAVEELQQAIADWFS